MPILHHFGINMHGHVCHYTYILYLILLQSVTDNKCRNRVKPFYWLYYSNYQKGKIGCIWSFLHRSHQRSTWNTSAMSSKVTKHGRKGLTMFRLVSDCASSTIFVRQTSCVTKLKNTSNVSWGCNIKGDCQITRKINIAVQHKH